MGAKDNFILRILTVTSPGALLAQNQAERPKMEPTSTILLMGGRQEAVSAIVCDSLSVSCPGMLARYFRELFSTSDLAWLIFAPWIGFTLWRRCGALY